MEEIEQWLGVSYMYTQKGISGMDMYMHPTPRSDSEASAVFKTLFPRGYPLGISTSSTHKPRSRKTEQPHKWQRRNEARTSRTTSQKSRDRLHCSEGNMFSPFCVCCRNGSVRAELFVEPEASAAGAGGIDS